MSTAHIVVLKAKCVRALWVCPDGPELLAAIAKVKLSLNEWYGDVPHQAQLSRSVSDPQDPVKDSIWFIHLLHLSTLMYICRRALQGFGDAEARDRLSDEQRALLNMALEDGLVAAEQATRLMTLLLEEARSPRHCWIAMYVTLCPDCHQVELTKDKQFPVLRFQLHTSVQRHSAQIVRPAFAGLAAQP